MSNKPMSRLERAAIGFSDLSLIIHCFPPSVKSRHYGVGAIRKF
ncbi:MAG: hypothetical protein AAF443_05140 [Chlamydiota bacterium]